MVVLEDASEGGVEVFPRQILGQLINALRYLAEAGVVGLTGEGRLGVVKQPLRLAGAYRSIAIAEFFQGIYLRCGRMDLLERLIGLLDGGGMRGKVLDVF
ncbi:hypothetical protein [Corynebacterium kefirresidentii]|uniref:hypothetical protein n=1 Tax=Corynebacterium kefirresidentii TaxID=1979527 RepID=UPI0020040B55|nr:hypothetical protein [Corynebacterium kefirresidentii]